MFIMNKFGDKSIKELDFYVYALVDPRNRKIFYIGKGSGNRVFQHCETALQDDKESLKLNLIRDIIASGAKVEHYILRHKLSEKEALQIESVLIDFLTYQKFNTEQVLTNIVSGHHQWDEGIKTVDEISAIYDCEKIKVNLNEHLLLVSLNKSFDEAKAHGVYQQSNIYDKTRQYWAISKYRAAQVDYVLGIYHGIVRSVLKVDSYEWTIYNKEKKTRFKKERCCFHGSLITDSPYLNKDVSDYPFGRRGAIRYISIKDHNY